MKEAAPPADAGGGLIVSGTPAFRRANLAMFAAGLSTFALLYCVQPLMPAFSAEFGIGAAESSLSLSVSTGLLAFGMLVASSLSESWGRKPVMVASLLVSAVLILLSSLMEGWHGFLLVRALAGITLSGLPAVAMAYLSEEMHPRAIGLAMGLYIGGSAMGGMAGRLGTAVLTDAFSWRFAVAAIGIAGIAAGLVFWRSLPESRQFRARALRPRAMLGAFADHVRDPGLRWLFLQGFLLMGGFVTLYNYISYRLLAPPYEVSQTVVGAIFTVYLVGSASSIIVGDLAGRLGRRKVLWATIVIMISGLALTMADGLAVIVLGIAVLTFGFFGAHSTVSSWVGRRALHARAQASSLYLFFYYLGSSVVGSAGGFFWSAWGWGGVVGLIGILLVVALSIALRLAVLKPIAQQAGA